MVGLAATVGPLAFVLLRGGGGYAIDARFADARFVDRGNLVNGNLVTIAGEQAGKVEGICLFDVPARDRTPLVRDLGPVLPTSRRRSPRSASSPRTSRRSSPICGR